MMKKSLYLLLFFCFLFNFDSLKGQTLSGKILDVNNEPIPFASVYVKELTLATYSNSEGLFNLKVPAGNYTILFQHLSYQTFILNVVIPQTTPLEVQLSTQLIQLNESLISSKNEDPAYAIMRKAIAHAPHYYQQLSSYKAKVYIRGSVVIDKISGMAKMMGGKELKNLGIKAGDSFLQEAISELELKQGKLTQRVVSETNTFPQIMNAKKNLEMGMISYNIYNPEPANMISPLAPQAFSYYKFNYQGFYLDDNEVINKIKITPRNQSKQAWSGYLYIADNKWYVSKYELSSQLMGVSSTISQTYQQQMEGIWIPIGFSLRADINIMGNKARLNYVNSIKYDDIVVNPNKLKQSNTVKSDTLNKKLDGLKTKLDEVSSKSKFTNRDAYKAARLLAKINKEQHKNLPDSLQSKPSLNADENYAYLMDSTAYKAYDSSYWATIRPIPLLNEEVLSYQIKDSIVKVRKDTIAKKSTHTGNLILGKRFIVDSSFKISYSGIIPLNQFDLYGYNAVDGIRYKQKVEIQKIFKDSTAIRIDVSAGYAFSRKKMLAETKFTHYFQAKSAANWGVKLSYDSKDFNINNSKNLDNMLWTLLAKRNYVHYFEEQGINFFYTNEPINGLSYSVNLAYIKQNRLVNNNDFSFFFKDRVLKPNNMDQAGWVSNVFNNNTSTSLALSISYTPQMRYYYRRNRKCNLGSTYPTFSLNLIKAQPNLFNSQSKYSFIEAGVRQKVKLGLSNFSYHAQFSWFINNSQMHFSEYKHFDTKPYYLSSATYLNSFNLVPEYAFDHNNWSLFTQINYTSLYIILKYLPILNASNIKEQLQITALGSQQSKYFEVSYNLTGIFLFGELGTYVGFDHFKYQQFGLRCAFHLIR